MKPKNIAVTAIAVLALTGCGSGVVWDRPRYHSAAGYGRSGALWIDGQYGRRPYRRDYSRL